MKPLTTHGLLLLVLSTVAVGCAHPALDTSYPTNEKRVVRNVAKSSSAPPSPGIALAQAGDSAAPFPAVPAPHLKLELKINPETVPAGVNAASTPVPKTPSTNNTNAASASATKNLWERIRAGYAMPDLESKLVRDREQWYTARPDYIWRMTERSKKYLFHIVEELELRNMPSELALLPFVESAFNPQAVSTAKAAGMWQFMPATGKHFELKQNAFRDDRRDVLASTRAALDYLKRLYDQFNDWHLALAAYNWGEGNVLRAIKKNQRLNLDTRYESLNMPMETRMYVPKLQAIKNIVANPLNFNSELPHIENHPYFQSVTIRRDIDVALAAKLAEVPLDDFKALNPSAKRPVILAAGTPQILLPWDNAAIFQSNLESYPGGRIASWTVWIAPRTMHPAEAAKRVGMREADLRSVNNIPKRMMIRAGSSLLVPRSQRVVHDVTEKVADNGQLSLSPEVTLKRRYVRAAKGDTVASLARKYKVNNKELAQWNKVSVSANFKTGQQVVLYTPTKKRSSVKTSRKNSKTASINKKSTRTQHSKAR